jgi:GAF domain-containing protein
LLTPIFTGDRWYGALLIGSLTPDAFPRNTEQFATAIGDQLAVVIENRRLFEESQQEARRNRALAETAQLSSQIGTDFVDGISKLLNVLATPADYDRWWFGAVSADGDHLERIAAQGIAAADLPDSIPIYNGSGALGEAARLNTPVVVNDRDHYSMHEIPASQARALGKHLVLPVSSADQLTGALLIGRGFERPDFDERDLQLIATLGNQLAIALENRRLFDTAETGRETLQSVLISLPAGVVVVDAVTHKVTL